MDLTKEAIKHLQESANKPSDRVVQTNFGYPVVIDADGEATVLHPEEYPAKEPLEINTLTGLINYIKSGLDQKTEMIVHIFDEKTVYLKGQLLSDGSRETLAVAKAIIPSFKFDYFYEMEPFIISLQAKFAQTSDRDALLEAAGNIKSEIVQNIGDDGVSQAIELRKGVASVVQAKVPNPVTLAPYRTFLEVSQPKSKFIFRMKDGPTGALFEADGGAWRNDAIKYISIYLETDLKELVKNKKITILA